MSDLPPYPPAENYRLLAEMNRIAASKANGPAKKAALERLAKVCFGACRPIDDKRGTIEFRRKVAGVLAKRAATTAYARAGGK